MLNTIFSIKFFIFCLFILSVLYVHFRGKDRFTFFRQLFDGSTFMAPINVPVYLFSGVPNQPFLDTKTFPDLAKLQENWQVIRDEAQNLYDHGYIKASTNYDDAGFNSFFRTGWKRFYLKWYDDFLPSAKDLCPKTIEILKTTPSINAAMFALLEKRGTLVKHRDPYAGSLRYHLGLMTPNSEKCRIYVDGIPYHWKDGEDVLFDETYLHNAINETDQDRIILFCDVDRPITNKVVAFLNRFFKNYIMAEAATRNEQTDRLGIINRLFKYVYSIRILGKKLKNFNLYLYRAVKYTIFLGLAYLIFFN